MTIHNFEIRTRLPHCDVEIPSVPYESIEDAKEALSRFYKAIPEFKVRFDKDGNEIEWAEEIKENSIYVYDKNNPDMCFYKAFINSISIFPSVDTKLFG